MYPSGGMIVKLKLGTLTIGVWKIDELVEIRTILSVVKESLPKHKQDC